MSFRAGRDADYHNPQAFRVAPGISWVLGRGDLSLQTRNLDSGERTFPRPPCRKGFRVVGHHPCRLSPPAARPRPTSERHVLDGASDAAPGALRVLVVAVDPPGDWSGGLGRVHLRMGVRIPPV